MNITGLPMRLAPVLLFICILLASSHGSTSVESLDIQQPNNTEVHFAYHITPLQLVNELTEMPVSLPSLLPTPVPDSGSMGGAGSRPLGVTLLGLSVLCTCALGPTLIIVAILGFVIRANRQRQIAYEADRNPGSSASGQEQ